MFSTFFTNFQAMNRYFLIPLHVFFFSPSGWLVPGSSGFQEWESQVVPREDIKAKWAAVKLRAVGQGHFREHAWQVGLQALTFVLKIPVLLKVTENSNFPGLFQCGKGQVSLNWPFCAGSELNLLIT